ncbi:MAG: esterase/lipase family protein [Pirellulaceae bacterium]
MPINLAMPTLGGMQFWTDHRWWKGWKIQQHASTGHWRLIDPLLVRRAWGPLESCEATLRKAMEAEPHQPEKHVTILLHGLMRTSRSMTPLATSLKQQRPGEMICFEYASTRASIDRHAEAFRNLVESLEGSPTIDLAAHSMGNIVVRRAIYDWRRPGGDPKCVLARLRSMVMLGPPNQGASIAKQLGRLELFGWITGRGGMELGPKWEDLSRKLSIPPCPFAVVAGKLDPRIPQNPLVEGASDFVVSVEETKLEGMTDFLEVPCLHSFLMDDLRVQQQVAHFMQHHSFSPSSNANFDAPGG